MVVENSRGHALSSSSSSSSSSNSDNRGEALLMVFGGKVKRPGSAAITLTNDVHTLDVANGVWSRIVTSGTPPCPRYCHSAVVIGGDMVVFGGWQFPQDLAVLNDVHVLHLDGNGAKRSWWSTPQISGVPPSPRCQSACFTVRAGGSHGSSSSSSSGSDFLVVFGGAARRLLGSVYLPYALSDLALLDTRTWSWLPVSRCLPDVEAAARGVAKYREGVYLSGGIHQAPDEVSSDPREGLIGSDNWGMNISTVSSIDSKGHIALLSL